MRRRITVRTVPPCRVAHRDPRRGCGRRVQSYVARLPLVLRRPLRVDTSVAHKLVSLAIAPRISLSFPSRALHTIVQRRVETARVSSSPVERVERVERTSVVERSHSATHTVRLARIEAAVQRLATTIVHRHDHYQRVEAPATFERVTQTLVRRKPAMASRIEPAASSPRAQPPRARVDVRAALQQATPTTIAPDELRRVTNHVISELDRRVLSYRERTGRY